MDSILDVSTVKKAWETGEVVHFCDVKGPG